MNNIEDNQKLIDISVKKKELLEEMLQLTQEQQNIIEKKEIEQLGLIIEEKQKRINSIDLLDEEFEKIYEDIKAESGKDNIIQDEAFTILGKEISEIMQIIEDIKVLEKNNSLKLNRQKDEVAKKLEEINKGKRAIDNYNLKPLPPKPVFFDKKK